MVVWKPIETEHGMNELQCRYLAVVSDYYFLAVSVRTIVINTPDIVAAKYRFHFIIKIIGTEIVKVILLDELCQWFNVIFHNENGL